MTFLILLDFLKFAQIRTKKSICTFPAAITTFHLLFMLNAGGWYNVQSLAKIVFLDNFWSGNDFNRWYFLLKMGYFLHLKTPIFQLKKSPQIILKRFLHFLDQNSRIFFILTGIYDSFNCLATVKLRAKSIGPLNLSNTESSLITYFYSNKGP